VFDRPVPITSVPLTTNKAYAADVNDHDVPAVDRVVMVHSAMCQHRAPLTPQASEAVKQLYREHADMRAVIGIKRSPANSYGAEAADDEGVPSAEYYDVCFQYPPNVQVRFRDWANVYRQDLLRVDPDEMILSVDWDNRVVLMRTRVRGHRNSRFTSGEHIFLETDFKQMVLPPPPSSAQPAAAVNKKRRLEDGSAKRVDDMDLY